MGLPQGSRGSEGVIACICFWLLLAGQAFGLVVSDDPSLHVVTPPSEFDRVGYISTSGGTTGVLIGPWHVLTAKHCVSYNGVPYGSGTFSLDLPSGRHTYSWTSANVSLHSTVDLAVITLDPNNYVGLPGYKLYTLLDEVGQTGILVGYGMSGTPATVGAGGDPNYPRGTKRFGYNQIDSIGGSFIKTIKMDFDDPATVGQPGGSLGADKEVMVADGDSGGSVFIKQNGILKVAGINSTIGYKDSTHWPRYGDSCSSIRVSEYASWISSFLPLMGDINLDNSVGYMDYLILSEHFGETDATWFEGDLDLDSDVDFSDYLLLQQHYGESR